jgi:transposase
MLSKATTSVIDPTTAIRLAMRSLACRIEQLNNGIDRLETGRDRLINDVAPALLEAKGVGYHSAATLLIAAGDNRERTTSEAAFANLCATAPARQLRPLAPPPAQPRRPPAS